MDPGAYAFRVISKRKRLKSSLIAINNFRLWVKNSKSFLSVKTVLYTNLSNNKSFFPKNKTWHNYLGGPFPLSVILFYLLRLVENLLALV
jgi:hypothetical protein